MNQTSSRTSVEPNSPRPTTQSPPNRGDARRQGTVYYLDPPYWGSEGDYGKALISRQDFQRLAEVLTGIKGQFLVSINDVPEIREIFAWARIEEVATTYTIAGRGQAKPAAELLIRGRPG